MSQLLRVVWLTQIRVKPNRRSNVDHNLNLSWPIVRVFFNLTNKTSVHPQNWCRARFFGRLRFNERERVCSPNRSRNPIHPVRNKPESRGSDLLRTESDEAKSGTSVC